MSQSLTKTNLILGLILVLVAGVFLGYFLKPVPQPAEKPFAEKTVDQQRLEWMDEANVIRGKLAMEGEYDCCLEEPCWYCIEEGECTCRQDILNGEHPCGECIGEILEGHGLAELKPYYAKAIAHKVGEQHLEHLQEIINDMYPEEL